MKIAYCLYGQPRMAKRGHENIKTFLQNVSVDFYMHVWHDPEKSHFECSPFRTIPQSQLEIEKDTIQFLLEAYRPVSCLIERPRILTLEDIQSSHMFHNSNDITRNNLNNTLSQMYSKQRVRDLLAPRAYEYDLVISSRFDFLNPICIDLQQIDASKLYVADFHRPRVIFPDNLVICNADMFLRLFNAYSDMHIIINDRALHNKMQENGEQAVLTPESILFASFLRHFSVEGHVVFTEQIPDFH